MGPGFRRDDNFKGVSLIATLLAPLRYTKVALLVFGFGVILGLVIVAGEYPRWERAASAVMALGLVLIPVGLFADGHGMVLVRWIMHRFRRQSRRRPAPRRRAAASRKRPVRAATRGAGRTSRPRRSR